MYGIPSDELPTQQREALEYLQQRAEQAEAALKLAQDELTNKEHVIQMFMETYSIQTAAITKPQDELDKMQKLLSEAANDIADWGAYADEYFQKKHDLAGTVAKYKPLPLWQYLNPVNI